MITNSAHWGYSASGSYGRPFDSGTLQGTWQASGGSATQFVVQSPSTLDTDGTWTTTGAASSSGSGSGAWSYSGSGSTSQSSAYGDSHNGGDSASGSHAAETYSQGWSSQYVVQSTLAANGSVTTVTTASASGGASGNHSYSSSGNSDSWSQTGDYAGGNGTSSESHYASGLSLTESLQSQWQEGYTFTSLPGRATTMAGSASGSTQTSGDASFFTTASGQTASVSTYSASGFSAGYSSGWSSGSDGHDHYSDQSSWSHGYAADGTQSSGYSSSNHVWGSLNSQWGNSSWWWSQGSGSGSSGSSSTGGSGSNSYDQATYSPGFGGPTGVHDAGWTWGVGWPGAGISGPQGPSAFRGVGYVFTPTNPVAVADVTDQSSTEGDSAHLQIQATDWSVGAASASGSGSGSGPYSASGLPAGLSINADGLISGTIQPGDAANGPYFVTVSYTDSAGNSASQSFLWNVADPVTFKDPGALFGAEGSFVSLAVPADDRIAGAPARTYSAVGLPGGLSIDSHTGVISGVLASGDAAAGLNVATVTATDGTYSGSQEVMWDVTSAPAGQSTDATPSAADAIFTLAAVEKSVLPGLLLEGIMAAAVPAADGPANGADPGGPAAGDVLDLTMPQSKDGTKGFVLHLEGAKLMSVTVTKKEGTDSNTALTNFLIGLASNETIEGFLKGALQRNVVDFASLPPAGTEPDLDRKVEIRNKEVKLTLTNQIIYDHMPDGTPYEVVVSGQIDVFVTQGWIAPSKTKSHNALIDLSKLTDRDLAEWWMTRMNGVRISHPPFTEVMTPPYTEGMSPGQLKHIADQARRWLNQNPQDGPRER